MFVQFHKTRHFFVLQTVDLNTHKSRYADKVGLLIYFKNYVLESFPILPKVYNEHVPGRRQCNEYFN